VGSLAPNDAGLYDVIGNVAEWCNDWFNPTVYTNGAVVDPTDAAPPGFLLGGSNRVVRGCGWAYGPLRRPSLSARGFWHPETGAMDIGFRVARSWSGETNAAPTAPVSMIELTNQLFTLTVGWMPPLSGNHDGYVMEVSGVVTTSLAASSTTWSLPGVLPGQTYQFSIVATNAHGASPSEDLEVLAFSAEPTAPRNLRTILNTPTNVTLNWDAPLSGNQVGYVVDRDTIVQTELGAGATSWVDTNVAAEDSFTYRVFATNELGVSMPAILAVTVSNHLCELAVSPASLDFGGLDTAMALSISNAGVGKLYWSNTVDMVNGSGWLSATPSGGTYDGSVTVEVDRTPLSAGSYTGRVIVAGNGGAETVMVYAVAQPWLDAQPGSLAFGYFLDDLDVLVTNAGIPGLTWTQSVWTADAGGWLSAVPVSGVEEANVTVSVDRSGIGLGLYTGRVVFSSAYNSTTVDVSMGKAVVDLWVDVDAGPGGDGLLSSTPTNDLQGALDVSAAGIGARVHIRGGGGRTYTNAVSVNKSHLRLLAWDESPLFLASTDIPDRVMAIAASDIHLSNLTFHADASAIQAGDSIIESSGTPDNLLIEDCEIRMLNSPGGAWNRGLAIDLGGTATNITIRDCTFADYNYGDGLRSALIGAPVGAYIDHVDIIGNTFTNVGMCISGGNHSLDYVNVVSNRFLNTIASETRALLYGSWMGIRYLTFSFNIVWNDNGLHPPVLMHPNDDALTEADVYNNTLVNAGHLATGSVDVADVWAGCRFYNNLVVSSAVAVVNGDAAGFDAATRYGYNLMYQTPAGFMTNGGSAVLVDTNYVADPFFQNVSEPGHAMFLVPDSESCPDITQGYGHIDPTYPTYIGAVLPIGPDVNGNGLPDAWESLYWVGNASGGADHDWDGDGAVNFAEWLAGTDPTDPRSVFQLVPGAESGGDEVVLLWASISNRVYDVYLSTNLVLGFNLYTGDVPATPPQNALTNDFTDTPCQFYSIGVREP